MTPLTILALATLGVWLLIGLDLVRGNRSLRSLAQVTTEGIGPWPRVTVVVAARNEARHLAEGVRSLLSLDYPDYELLVVNDRSEDETGLILDSLAAADPRLSVLHLHDLPPGWLGKNHALHLGAERARGELVLFTDADIVMEPTALSRAVAMLLEQGLDHLTVSPAMTMPTPFLQMFGASFVLFFAMFVRPWKARDPKSPCHVGIGAFNLVRLAAYRSVGGHETIRLRPDDDLKLGKIIKRGGFRSDLALGSGFLSVEWYASVGEVIRGLEKNAFAGCDYRVTLALSGSAFHLVATIWPYLALVLCPGTPQLIYGAVVLLLTVLQAGNAQINGFRRWHALGLPLATGLFVWIILRTMVLNLAQGGIRWRGTFYSLTELKSNRV